MDLNYVTKYNHTRMMIEEDDDDFFNNKVQYIFF